MFFATLAPHCVPWHRPPHRPGVLPGGQVWCSAGEQSPRSTRSPFAWSRRRSRHLHRTAFGAHLPWRAVPGVQVSIPEAKRTSSRCSSGRGHAAIDHFGLMRARSRQLLSRHRSCFSLPYNWLDRVEIRSLARAINSASGILSAREPSRMRSETCPAWVSFSPTTSM